MKHRTDDRATAVSFTFSRPQFSVSVSHLRWQSRYCVFAFSWLLLAGSLASAVRAEQLFPDIPTESKPSLEVPALFDAPEMQLVPSKTAEPVAPRGHKAGTNQEVVGKSKKQPKVAKSLEKPYAATATAPPRLQSRRQPLPSETHTSPTTIDSSIINLQTTAPTGVTPRGSRVPRQKPSTVPVYASPSTDTSAEPTKKPSRAVEKLVLNMPNVHLSKSSPTVETISETVDDSQPKPASLDLQPQALVVEKDSFQKELEQAQAGVAASQLHVGLTLHTGKAGVPADKVAGFRWLLRAAEAGADTPVSLRILGRGYFFGTETVQNFKEARRWLKKLADAGDTDAMNDFAYLLYNGIGGPQEYGAALQLYEAAAKLGDAKSQANAGIMHEFSIGCQQNQIRAYAWYLIASFQKNQLATQRREILGKKLTLKEIEDAQQLAVTLRPDETPTPATEKKIP